MRAGVYRACRELGLRDMLTLTLPEGARGSTSTESRTTISRMFNAFRTALRKRGYCGDYIAVPEAHQDGSAHLHVALNLEPMVWGFGNDLRAVQEALQAAWHRLGGGWIWYGRGRARRGRTGASAAAAYLSKYLGKSQAKPTPWDDVRYCTEDGSFRARPWHRFWPSRRAGAIIAGPEPDSAGYELGNLVARPNAKGFRFEPWTPALGSAIVPICDGHEIRIGEWTPGECHHDFEHGLHVCFCVPPWASEPPWAPLLRQIAALAEWNEAEILCPSSCTCDLHRPRELRDDSMGTNQRPFGCAVRGRIAPSAFVGG